MTPADALLFVSAGILFLALGGLWADRWDAAHRDAKNRNRP